MVRTLRFLNFKYNQLFFVGIGSVPGALIRWHFSNNFLVNIFGAYVLGLVCGLSLRKSCYLFFAIGFCGSLTSFSGWMLDSAILFTQGFYYESLKLVFSTLFFGLISVSIGFFLGKRIKKIGLFQ